MLKDQVRLLVEHHKLDIGATFLLIEDQSNLVLIHGLRHLYGYFDLGIQFLLSLEYPLIAIVEHIHLKLSLSADLLPQQIWV
jgi:hypothetical protein